MHLNKALLSVTLNLVHNLKQPPVKVSCKFTVSPGTYTDSVRCCQLAVGYLEILMEGYPSLY